MAKYKFDAFISYSHSDENWVVNILLDRLEKAGLKVCIDFRDFMGGKPALLNMQDAVDKSRYTILVMTKAWVKSEWTLYESILSRTDDPAGLGRRTIPLKLEDCKIPKFISMLTWIDFTRKDREAIAWKRLFTALGKPDAPTPTTPTLDSTTPVSWHLVHPYPMPPNFTGRVAERTMLTKWLNEDTENRLFILRAIGGFGKSALAWHWLTHDVDPAQWTKALWWSFYEGDASFEHFIEETLTYLKLEVPQGQRPQVDELLKAMQSQKILLIMDGFERVLRLYGNMNAAYQNEEEQEIKDYELDCKDINAEWFLKGICSLPNIKSKVLMTTRLTPRVVKTRGEFILGCREEELTAMQKVDAVEFFRKQKIKGTYAEIQAACAPYGYHPLSLRILAGLITNDREKPGDITVADDLDITDNIIQNKNHVLKVSYDTLSFGQQKLLSNMACFRSSMRYEALKFITNKPSWKRKNKSLLNEKLDDSLSILESRGLINWDRSTNKYDLHPIVRRYCYERLTLPDRTTAHARLRDYFAAIDAPAKPQTLDELTPVNELYHHTIKAGNLDAACHLYYDRIWNTVYYRLAAYKMQIEMLLSLFPDGENEPPHLKDEKDQAWAVDELANAYSMSGQPRRAVPLFDRHNKLRKKHEDKNNLGIGLGNMADDQRKVGALQTAEANLRYSQELGKEIQDQFLQAVGHLELGHLLIYRGLWDESEQELYKALDLFQEKLDFPQGIGQVWLYQSLRHLLMRHDSFQNPESNQDSSIQFAQNSLKLVEKDANTSFPVERDFVRTHWLSGAAYRLGSQINLAEHHLGEALTRCRAINLVEIEADILLDLARLRYDQKNYEEAKSLAEEALTITERCGYVLQGADVNLFLAQYALEQEKDKTKAKACAQTALKLATCDGPPYYYKVAYEEAVAMLERWKVLKV